MSLAHDYRAELHAAHVERRRRLSAPVRIAPPSRVEQVVIVRRTSSGPDACEHVRLWRVLQEKPVLPQRRIIAQEVCTEHTVSFALLCGPRRTADVVRIRQLLFYRLGTETEMSLQQIGRFLGGKDHTTVPHGIRRHAQRHGLPTPRAGR